MTGGLLFLGDYLLEHDHWETLGQVDMGEVRISQGLLALDSCSPSLAFLHGEDRGGTVGNTVRLGADEGVLERQADVETAG